MNNQLTPQINKHKKKNHGVYGIGNPGPGFGQESKCGRVKPVNGIPTFLSLEIGFQKAIQI
jgi:hypothetical protein